MAADENRLFIAIGVLQSAVENLRHDFHALQETSTKEHRTVHDIVVAMSESVRNLARDVAEMKPLTDDYRLKAEALAEAIKLTKDYQEKRAEARGAAKFATALWVAAGGLIMFALTKLTDLFPLRPHP